MIARDIRVKNGHRLSVDMEKAEEGKRAKNAHLYVGRFFI